MAVSIGPSGALPTVFTAEYTGIYVFTFDSPMGGLEVNNNGLGHTATSCGNDRSFIVLHLAAGDTLQANSGSPGVLMSAALLGDVL